MCDGVEEIGKWIGGDDEVNGVKEWHVRMEEEEESVYPGRPGSYLLEVERE